VVFAAALVMLASTGCAKLQARDHLNKGVQAYKNSKFEQAIDHFQQAVALDPTLINARLYLATAYAQQYIPGADTPDNNRYAEQAIDQYKQVLQVDPKNINSIKGIAYLYLQMKKFDLAKEYYKKGFGGRSERSRAVLLGGGDRLDPDLCAASGRARQTRHEARGLPARQGQEGLCHSQGEEYRQRSGRHR
jgi:tetratricopeptide (TPR) repeat protein